MKTGHFTSEKDLKKWAAKKGLKFVSSLPTEDPNSEQFIAEMRGQSKKKLSVVTCSMMGRKHDDWVIFK